MKKKLSIVVTGAILCSFMAPSVLAAEKNSNGVINFTPDTSITEPVDPTDPDPEVPVAPIDPTDPEGPDVGTAGPLSIDFASSYSFGDQKIATIDKTYHAAIQEFVDSSAGPNYVQVTDKRGSLEGWKLSVKQNGQFTSADDQELVGAEITLLKGSVASDLDDDPTLIPAVVAEKVQLKPTGEEFTVVEAAENQGIGTWVYRSGANAAEGATGVELAVPGRSIKRATEYRTTITWTLSSTPTTTPEED